MSFLEDMVGIPRKLAAVAVVCSVGVVAAAPAGAASTPLVGSAVSNVTLVDLSVLGHNVQAVTVKATTSTVTKATSLLSVIPATIDGTSYGAQTLTPADGTKSIATPNLPVVLPAGLLSVTPPTISAGATNGAAGPYAQAGVASLGAVHLLTLPLSVNGSLAMVAGTTSSSAASKHLKVTNLALPSLNDLLGALGLDLSALPVPTLDSLLTQLNLPTTGLAAADSAVASAQAALGSSVDRLRDAQALVTSLSSALTAAQTAETAANSALQSIIDTFSAADILAAGLPSSPTVADYLALAPSVKAVLQVIYPSLVTAEATLNSAIAAVGAATTDLANGQALVSALTSLGNLVKGVLDSTPLVSISSVDVSTLASAAPTLAAKVTGAVTGVHVLGTDVLKKVTGSSTLDVLGLTSSLGSQLQGAINSVTGTLSDVLSSVPGVSGLSFPTPSVKVLQKTTSTSKTSKASTAKTTVTALQLSIPSFTVPSALALPGASSLPGLTAVTGAVPGIATPSIALKVGVLGETASAYPVVHSVTGGGTPTGPTLATTGMPAGIALGGALLLGLAVLVRRVRGSSEAQQ